MSDTEHDDTPTKLDHSERRQAADLTGTKAPLIYEAIRLEGEHELSRPAMALWWSGVAAGLTISLSVLGKGVLEAKLADVPWRGLVSNFGYALGFMVVVLGRMQLFTENTVTPILPLLRNPTARNLGRTARLWALVFAANMVGCFLAALAMGWGDVIPEAAMGGVLSVSREYVEATFAQHLAWGIPAGFMMASLVWLLPSLEGAGELVAILLVTYMIGAAGLSHVVAGATELFLMALLDEITWEAALVDGVLPSFLGNVLGGSGLFAVLTYAQVRREI